MGRRLDIVAAANGIVNLFCCFSYFILSPLFYESSFFLIHEKWGRFRYNYCEQWNWQLSLTNVIIFLKPEK